ncbi:hypothetical protein ABZ478_33390 [Streptomyces sp. NPDC005706]|uniref:hypothetical protein n=1 Tax=Streptomyces sp. NPDC005706 TaxID=3157169 RepID=UPI0033E440A1
MKWAQLSQWAGIADRYAPVEDEEGVVEDGQPWGAGEQHRGVDGGVPVGDLLDQFQ